MFHIVSKKRLADILSAPLMLDSRRNLINTSMKSVLENARSPSFQAKPFDQAAQNDRETWEALR